MNRNPRVFHAQIVDHSSRLFEDGGAVVRRNPRLQRNLDSPALPRFEGDVNV